MYKQRIGSMLCAAAAANANPDMYRDANLDAYRCTDADADEHANTGEYANTISWDSLYHH